MLNDTQISYLAGLSDFGMIKIDSRITGITASSFGPIKVSMADFKVGMGLNDIRLGWLLSPRCCMAGGAVLSWITGANNHNDYDFFFTDRDAADNFKRFIEGYGFVPTKETGYALTCFNEEERLIVQIVGGGYSHHNVEEMGFFGDPTTVISRFDLTACMFAVDCDYLYTHSIAIRDVITRSIRTMNVAKHELTTHRMFKYYSKGFYIPNDAVKYNDQQSTILPTTQLTSW